MFIKNVIKNKYGNLHQLRKGARIVKNLQLKHPHLKAIIQTWYMFTIDIIKPKKPNSAKEKQQKYVYVMVEIYCLHTGMGHNITNIAKF